MLNVSQIKQILEKPRNLKVILEARRQEKRIKFHCETVLDETQINEAASNFLGFVKKLLPSDKYMTFLSVYKYPVDTVRLTGKTFQTLSQVFESRNPVLSIDMVSEDLIGEAKNYVRDQKKFWATEGFNAMKTRINSFVVVDLPYEQQGDKPEPYQYFVDIDSVLDYLIDEYLIFKVSEELLVVIDRDSYQTYHCEDGNLDEIRLESETFHNLGKAPFSFFWDEDISFSKRGVKKSPISDWLGQLDWILFYQISKKCSDLYAPWSIYWGYVQDCDYVNDLAGHRCESGFLQNSKGQYLHNSDYSLKKCPACSDRIAGVGAFIDVPIPLPGEQPLVPPAGIIKADVMSLEYNVKEIDRLETEFYQGITGVSLSLLRGTAINEKQVLSMFESQKQALTHIKNNFEKIINWTEGVKLQLRYGDSFKSFFHSMGTEWYLIKEDVLIDMYVKAKKEGLDVAVLDFLQDQIFETKYKNNPNKLRETKIILDIDPFRHLSIGQVMEMYSNNVVGGDDFYIKANLSSLLMKFIRENGSLINFGELMTYDEKISTIKETLKTYYKKPEVRMIEEPVQN